MTKERVHVAFEWRWTCGIVDSIEAACEVGTITISQIRFVHILTPNSIVIHRFRIKHAVGRV